MENQDQLFTLPEEALSKTTSVGCLQFFPIFFLLLIALAGFVLSISARYHDTGTPSASLFNYEEWIVVAFLFVALIGLIIGIISSIFFFSARNRKNINTMKKGIMLNIVAWIIYTICLLVSITFILDI